MPSLSAHVLDLILRMHIHKQNLQIMGRISDPLKTAGFMLSRARRNKKFKVPFWLFWDMETHVFYGNRAVLVCPDKLSLFRRQAPVSEKRTNVNLIVYLHGGGYFNNILTEHWHFIRRLVKETNCAVLVYDYLLTPENTYRQVFNDLYRFYNGFVNGSAWLNKEWDFKKIFFAGDSAGAGLALAFTMHLRNLKKRARLPDGLFLLSPFLDVTCSNPNISKYVEKDLILDAAGARAAGMIYSGAYLEKSPQESQQRMRHWMVSPIYGYIKGLPPVHIFGGGKEIFRPDMEKFHNMLVRAGNRCSFHIGAGMQHVYMIFAIPEGIDVIRMVSRYADESE